MAKIIGVRFRQAGKIYHFSPGDLDIKINNSVIVETARGQEFGRVVMGPKEIADDQITNPLKPVMRIATNKDVEASILNKAREKSAIQICKEKVAARGLDMKIIDAELTFDNNKALFYFTADGRIDFRELVKDLATVFRTRIELRQIGVRDETKLLGGVGVCGRELCCNKYLTEFAPVSIKMAKNQGLPLNPTKISGVCGRLMCCLNNEEETYDNLNSKLPAIGTKVKCEDGAKGEVISLSILKQLVKVRSVAKNGDKVIKEYPVDEISFTHSFKEQLNGNEEEMTEDVAKLIEGSQERTEKKNRSNQQANGNKKKPKSHNNRPKIQSKDQKSQKDNGGEMANKKDDNKFNKNNKNKKQLDKKVNTENRDNRKNEQGKRPFKKNK